MSNLTVVTKDASYLSQENFEHAFRMAKMIATTQLIPKAYHNKPADVLVAFEFGRTLGLGYLQAVQNIAVVNGRPCLWGDAMLAVCQAHRDFEYIKEKPVVNETGEIVGFECYIKRKSYPEETVRRFTSDDAKKAGLWGRNTWASYPARMLQMRARGFALRDTFADALSGVSMVEEVDDFKPAATIKQEKNVEAKEELIALLSKPTPIECFDNEDKDESYEREETSEQQSEAV